ncbi:hypothetical protein KKF84_21065 [Myxococcota bacterium]|nr:hypothetical protein [Myxococcota bacterium]
MLLTTLLTLFVFSQSTDAQVEFTAGAGVSRQKAALTAGAGLDVTSGKLSLGISVPVVVLLEKADVSVDKRLWDTPTDYAYAIRYLGFRSRIGSADFGLLLGETHDVTLGFGGVARHFNPLIHFDSPHSGAQLGFVHKRIRGFFFIDDFVAPKIGGFSLRGEGPGGLFAGGSLFADPSMPYTMNDPGGTVHVDRDAGTLIPFSTGRFLPLSVFLGYAFNESFVAAVEGITLDLGDGGALGIMGHLEGTLKGKTATFSLKISGGGGGDHFQPFTAGPFYLMQREFSDSGATSMARALAVSENPGYGMALDAGVKLSFSQNKSLEVRGSFSRNRFADVMNGTVTAFISQKMALAFFGAVDTQKNGIFSLHGRIALSPRWFVWTRAKRLFAISAGNDYYEPRLQILAGLGYRENSD